MPNIFLVTSCYGGELNLSLEEDPGSQSQESGVKGLPAVGILDNLNGKGPSDFPAR